jgi:hypothetical protein
LGEPRFRSLSGNCDTEEESLRQPRSYADFKFDARLRRGPFESKESVGALFVIDCVIQADREPYQRRPISRASASVRRSAPVLAIAPASFRRRS